MELLGKLLPALVAIICVPLGWMLNSLSQIKKDTREDNRIRNEVLFYLLELRHLITSLDVWALRRVYTEEMKRRIQMDHNSVEFKNLIDYTIENVISQLLKPILEIKYPPIKIEFPRVVAKLSAVNPLLAYELSDKENIITYVDHFKTFFNNSMPGENLSAQEAALKERLLNTLDTETILQTTETIDELLFKLSREVSGKMANEMNQKLEALKIRNKSLDESAAPMLMQLLDSLAVTG